MATYIRTITDQYDFNIVIDVTDNEEFVNTTGFDWINIGDLTAKNGDFFYDNKIISHESEDYTIIEEVMFEKVEANNIIIREEEEKKRQQAEQEWAEEVARAEAENEAIAVAERAAAAAELAAKPEVLPEHLRPVPENFEEVLATIPKPKLIDYREEFKDVDVTVELLKEWVAKNKEMTKFVAALSTATQDGKKVVFNPAYVRNAGTELEETLEWMYMPWDTVTEYYEHMVLQLEQLGLYLNLLKSTLGLIE